MKKNIKDFISNLTNILCKSKTLTFILLLSLLFELIPISQKCLSDVSNIYNSKDWGLGYNKNSLPTGTDSVETLRNYDAYFLDDSNEKVVYLTFDSGYENGYTNALLDTLKEKNVPATFFLVGNYFKTDPDLVKRMVDEGHIVGNHTMTHPKLSGISDIAHLKEELEGVEKLYTEITGKQMKKIMRPPSGNYSLSSLQMTKDLGYSSIFWSVAYVDWINDKQPSHSEAFDKLMNRLHDGAIILLHSNSKTNCEILGEFIDKVENEGYTFKSLDYLLK